MSRTLSLLLYNHFALEWVSKPLFIKKDERYWFDFGHMMTGPNANSVTTECVFGIPATYNEHRKTWKAVNALDKATIKATQNFGCDIIEINFG